MGSKFTITSFNESKNKKQKISVLTAYDYPTAKVISDQVDVLLVGDSVGMVKMGYENTLEVTVEDMVTYSKSVRRGSKEGFIVTDMPYLSYGVNEEKTVENAGRIIRQGRANAVKLEGGSEIIGDIEKLIKCKIPVMGHLGLTPQSVNAVGGFKVQGKSSSSAEKIVEDALRLQRAGVFALVLECIPGELSRIITEKLTIPTIGIGAGKDCDGQVLVVDDMLGMNEHVPRFVKKYSDIHSEIRESARRYNEDVKNGDFPTEEHSFKIDREELEQIERLY